MTVQNIIYKKTVYRSNLHPYTSFMLPRFHHKPVKLGGGGGGGIISAGKWLFNFVTVLYIKFNKNNRIHGFSWQIKITLKHDKCILVI